MGTGDFVVDDDKFKTGTDDTFNVATQDDDTVTGGGGDRQLDQATRGADKTDFIMEGSALDIAVFRLVRSRIHPHLYEILQCRGSFGICYSSKFVMFRIPSAFRLFHFETRL